MNISRMAVIVPALDEEEALPLVLEDLGRLGLLGSTIVVDNGSRDRTAPRAAAAGARVVAEPRRGYGAACLRGLAAVEEYLPDAEIIVFLDGDRSDDPMRIPALVSPLASGERDMVLGSRTPSLAAPGAQLGHQRAGTSFYCRLIALLFRHRYTDLGPFRAITRDALGSLHMSDRGFGWTAEMQVKALKRGLRVLEVPVPTRPRLGRSKISGTLTGTAGAAIKIGWTILKLRLTP